MDTQEFNSLIGSADYINAIVQNNDDWTEGTIKELKKVEMYCRKTYLMLKHVHNLDLALCDENEFLTKLNAALIRDQKYVKVRDGMEEYSIDG